STVNLPVCSVSDDFTNPPPDGPVTQAVRSKVAVKVVSLTGVLISWVLAPPSDQDRNERVSPPEVCGVTAPMGRKTPSTPVNVKGAVTGCPSRVNRRPGGVVVSKIIDVRGSTLTLSVAVRPPESLTVSMIR